MQIKEGLEITTTFLHDSKRIKADEAYISARRANIKGKVLRCVPCNGGDVWFVEHHDTKDIGVYSSLELTQWSYWLSPEYKGLFYFAIKIFKILIQIPYL